MFLIDNFISKCIQCFFWNCMSSVCGILFIKLLVLYSLIFCQLNNLRHNYCVTFQFNLSVCNLDVSVTRWIVLLNQSLEVVTQPPPKSALTQKFRNLKSWKHLFTTVSTITHYNHTCHTSRMSAIVLEMQDLSGCPVNNQSILEQ